MTEIITKNVGKRVRKLTKDRKEREENAGGGGGEGEGGKGKGKRG